MYDMDTCACVCRCTYACTGQRIIWGVGPQELSTRFETGGSFGPGAH